MQAVSKITATPKNTDLDGVAARYKQLHAQVNELVKKVGDEEKRVAELLDRQKVKTLLKDIINQPQ